MASFKKKTSVAILGGGLSGLALAARLERAGLDYLLFDAQDFGGLTKGQNVNGAELDYGLKSIPLAGPLNENALVSLKADLDLKIQIESFSDPAQYFDNKNFSEFMGFGENKNRSLIEELTYYTYSPRLLVSGGWRKLVDELLSIIPEEKRVQNALITRLVVNDEEVVAASINGESVVHAKQFVFTLSPAHLKEMLSPGAVSGKTLQRIARTEPFTAISLDLASESKTTDAKCLYVLRDFSKANDEEIFVLGQFTSNVDPSRPNGGYQLSTWMTLVDPETCAVDENGSKIIKNVKKVISKAFPELIQNAKWERLLVVPSALGNFNQLTLEKDFSLPGLSNLFVCGGQVQGSNRNLAAALDSAKNVAKSILATQQENASSMDANTDPPEASL